MAVHMPNDAECCGAPDRTLLPARDGRGCGSVRLGPGLRRRSACDRKLECPVWRRGGPVQGQPASGERARAVSARRRRYARCRDRLPPGLDRGSCAERRRRSTWRPIPALPRKVRRHRHPRPFAKHRASRKSENPRDTRSRCAASSKTSGASAVFGSRRHSTPGISKLISQARSFAVTGTVATRRNLTGSRTSTRQIYACPYQRASNELNAQRSDAVGHVRNRPASRCRRDAKGDRVQNDV